VKLLQDIHKPTSGVIYWDDTDTTYHDQKPMVVSVPQETQLFNRTVFENISYGKPESTLKDIISAATNANCDDFINDLDTSYNTKIGENGGNLSGGQRQRLAIARALILRPNLLIFDEATSSLDNVSEQLIHRTIENQKGSQTMVIVSHKISTIRGADQIIVVDDGKIVGKGTHVELLTKCDVYQKLCSID
jgi:ATP-binding cassette subfamily B protein